MRKLGLYWLLLVTTGCTERNARYCGDGACVDPAFPYCDRDGAIAGEPNTCIAVTCTAGEFVTCNGNEETVCNDVGDSYDVRECAVSCDSQMGCIECNDDAECSNPTPVCDASKSCRACTQDNECPSLVCDNDGTCRDADTVVYAASMGVDSGACDQAAPCSLQHALSVAAANQLRSMVHLEDGAYATQQEVLTIDGVNIDIVGSDAAVVGNDGMYVDQYKLVVTNGAHVTIRGTTWKLGSSRGIHCTRTMGGKSLLRLEHATLDRKLPVFDGCDVYIVESNVSLRGDAGGGCSSSYPDLFHIERSYISTDTSDVKGVVNLGPSCVSRVTDSVFDNVWVNVLTGAGAVASVQFAFNTVIANGPPVGWGLRCNPQGGTIQASIENNIIFASTNAIEDSGTSCANGSRHNIVFPQAKQLPANNRVVDPVFADLNGRDFHLRATSPGVDTAVPSSGLESDRDIEGTSRPQGAQPDVGAYEYAP